MYETQRIDTSDIDRMFEKKRNDAIQQLYNEIVNQVDMRVNTGQISTKKQNNGMRKQRIGAVTVKIVSIFWRLSNTIYSPPMSKTI